MRAQPALTAGTGNERKRPSRFQCREALKVSVPPENIRVQRGRAYRYHLKCAALSCSMRPHRRHRQITLPETAASKRQAGEQLKEDGIIQNRLIRSSSTLTRMCQVLHQHRLTRGQKRSETRSSLHRGLPTSEQSRRREALTGEHELDHAHRVQKRKIGIRWLLPSEIRAFVLKAGVQVIAPCGIPFLSKLHPIVRFLSCGVGLVPDIGGSASHLRRYELLGPAGSAAMLRSQAPCRQ